MAPVPTTSSPAKGKARAYLCGPCGCRHSAPTGRNCRQQKQRKARAALVDTRRSPLKSGEKPKRKVGRPRKQPVPVLPVADDSMSEEESIESVLLPLQRASAGRPVPAPRFRVPTATTRRAATPLPGPSDDTVLTETRGQVDDGTTTLGNATRSAGPGQSDTQLILEQIAQLRANNSAEIRRIELEARQERLREQEGHKAEKEFLTNTILSIQQSIASLRAPVAPDAPVSAPVTVAASPAANAPVQPRLPVTELRNPPVPIQPTQPPHDVAAAPVSQAPTVSKATAVAAPSLQGQPAAMNVTAEDISTADDPIQMLRRDKPSSNVASLILQEVGLTRVIELDKAQKGKASNKSSNKIKAGAAKWPNDYVIRLDSDEDPTYDSLTETEFVSGYISIMAEVTPNIPQNAKLIQHLLYLRQLMDDCASLDWAQVRTAHRLVLMAIVHQRLDWSDAAAVKEEKAVALNRVRRKIEVPTPKPATNPYEVPCAPYQKNTCLYSGDHIADGITALHCCAHCHKKTGKQHPHMQKDCHKYNRNNRPKNGKQPARRARNSLAIFQTTTT